jgi:hypothetical protein
MSSLTISSLGAITTYVVNQEQTPTDKALTALGNALKSSDLDSAEEDASALKQSLTNSLISSTASSNQAASDAVALLSNNLEVVSKAIQSGDTDKAQREFNKLQGNYKKLKLLANSLRMGSQNESSSIASLIFNGSLPQSSRSQSASATANIEKLLSSYSDYMYYLSTSGTIKPTIPPGTYLNEQA